ncbi:MAG: 30S ribosomal protein S3 [Nanoarchaeota archaeon]|nr:30S ribosomal protein S3 [Nanoarchaeota archaeon]
MIERQFINQKLKEHAVQEYIGKELGKSGYSHTQIKRTPLGEKVVVYTSRPGLVVGKKGENIQRMTQVLKKKFKMENPQIEIGEIQEPYLDVHFVADRIASTFERFGSKRFKSIGYKMLQSIMDAGGVGAEIVISGKVPSARAKSWRFKVGYLKKSGDLNESLISKEITASNLKSGTIGIKVSIMTPDLELPDRLIIKSVAQVVQEQEAVVVAQAKAVQDEKDKPKKEVKKRAPRKKKVEEKVEEVKADGQDKKE